MNSLNNKPNSLIFWFSKTGDFFLLSIVWLLLCLPIVTIVPASISLYNSIAHCVRGKEEGSVRFFFKTLKAELLKGILIDILWLVIGFILVFGFRALYILGLQNPVMSSYAVLYLITMFIPLGIFAWLIPVQSRFEHTFGSLHKAAVVYAIAHLPYTIAIVLLFIAAVALTLLAPALIVLLPAITVTLQSWFIEKAFSKHMPAPEEAEETSEE